MTDLFGNDDEQENSPFKKQEGVCIECKAQGRIYYCHACLRSFCWECLKSHKD